MRRLGLALAPLLVALAACGAAPEPVAVAPEAVVFPAEPKYDLEVDPAGAARVKQDVTFLASPELAGRGTGEPGARLAADFVAKRFNELHLDPLGDTDGATRTYLQQFRARVGAKAEEPAIAWLKHPAANNHATTRPPRGVAEGSATGTAHGIPVLVGYGISAPALGWDDYAKGDMSGKIAVVLDGAPHVERNGTPDALHDFGSIRYKLRTAREHGAVGAIIVAHALPPPPAEPTSMGIPAVVIPADDADAELDPQGSAKAAGTPGKGFLDPKLWSLTAPATPRQLARLEIQVTTKVDPVDATAWNVVGLLAARAGSPHADEYVVVGAHYDHLGHGGTSASRAPGSHEIHPGADDNASGTALMLEVALRLACLPKRLERGVIFIGFGAEELGVLGSRHFVEHLPVPLESISAMINADMVGRLRGDKLVVDGIATAKEWPEFVKQADLGLGLDLALGAEGFGASDHTSFTTAHVPVAFLFTGVHDDYHRPSDTADKINAEGEERVATLAARLALEVSEAPKRLAFVDAPPDPHQGMRGGFRVSLGTLPDYAFDGKGVRITGTRADSPAARSGLLPGDVIVKVGPHEVSNIHDYMFSLGDLEAGREVEVIVERGKDRKTLRVVPAPPR